MNEELQRVLQYSEWRKFEGVINKAKDACKNSGMSAFDHFVGTDKPIISGKGKRQLIKDYKLTRYACYLISQTEQKLKRDNIKGEDKANKTHYNVGKKVRETIKELGGTMPEDMLTPKKSLKQLEKENKKYLV